jgi:hypothetical protein
LPSGNVGVSGGSYASIHPLVAPIYSPPTDPVLTVTTTTTTQLYLVINCTNTQALSENYAKLNLFLYAHTIDGETPLLGSVSLLSSGITLTYALPHTPGTYSFDYIIQYTPSAVGTLAINLSETISTGT